MLDHPSEERAAYLTQACGADDELRREVETMLAALQAAEDSDSGFLEKPPSQLAAAVAAAQPGALRAGEALGHFEIEALLGRGGMGEVYLARDVARARPGPGAGRGLCLVGSGQT
ncbi:MAG: hypothetical protein HYR56_14245 [Acidobacteria bacterium]|nr:hypothetical protein [Acidobacteriota bacterium]